MRKGQKHSDATKKKLKCIIQKLYTTDPTYSKRISVATIAAMSSPLIRAKIRAGVARSIDKISGKNHWTAKLISGVPISPRIKIRNSLKGKHFHKKECKCAFCGDNSTPEINYKKGNAFRGKRRPPFSNAWKANIAKAITGTKNPGHSKWMIAHPIKRYRNTLIEQKIASILRSLNIKFKQNYNIDNIANVDFYLQEYNLIIECDGCYHHSCTKCNFSGVGNTIERDIRKSRLLRKAKYRLLRFKGHTINKNIELCKKQILKYIVA